LQRWGATQRERVDQFGAGVAGVADVGVDPGAGVVVEPEHFTRLQQAEVQLADEKLALGLAARNELAPVGAIAEHRQADALHVGAVALALEGGAADRAVQQQPVFELPDHGHRVAVLRRRDRRRCSHCHRAIAVVGAAAEQAAEKVEVQDQRCVGRVGAHGQLELGLGTHRRQAGRALPAILECHLVVEEAVGRLPRAGRQALARDARADDLRRQVQATVPEPGVAVRLAIRRGDQCAGGQELPGDVQARLRGQAEAAASQQQGEGASGAPHVAAPW